MMLELIYIVVYYSTIATASYHIYLFLRYNKIVRFAWTLNGWWLPLVPFIGNIYLMVFMEGKLNLLSGLILAQKWFGIPFGVWYGSQFIYLNDDAEECKIILNHPKCMDKATIYNNVGLVFGNSLISIDGKSWKSRRRYLRAAFKTETLGNFMPTFFQQSNGLIVKIKNKQPDDCLFKFFTRYAFINFYLTSSGFNEDDITPEVERTGWLIDSCQDEFVKLYLNPVIPASIWLNTPLGAKLKQHLNEAKQLLEISLVHKMTEKKANPEFIDKQNGVTFIDLLLDEEYEKAPGSDIFGEYSLFAAAASDTTGHTLAFCFTLLGMYPEVQHKLYEEIESVLGDENIDKLKLEDLKYTEMVLNETMRIFPSAPLFARNLGEDVDVGTRIIPKGVNFAISAYHLHRKPEYWNNPLKFDPERFLPENIQNIVPGSFLPFSSGPRNCIGQVSAMKMMMVTVANVVRSFEIFSDHKTIEEFRLESCLSMKAGHPLNCTFKERS